MVNLHSVGSWEVRKKANTRNLLNFHVSCTRANLPHANLFKYCSYKFDLRCYLGEEEAVAFSACVQTQLGEGSSPGAQAPALLLTIFFSFSSLSNFLSTLSYPFLEQSDPISEWRYLSMSCYAACYVKSVILDRKIYQIVSHFPG